MGDPVSEAGFERVEGDDGGLEHAHEKADVHAAGGQEVAVGAERELRVDVLPDIRILPIEAVQNDPRALARRAEVVGDHARGLDGVPVVAHLVRGDLVGKLDGVLESPVGRVFERDGAREIAHVLRLELGPEAQDMPAVGIDVGRPVHEIVGALEIGVEIGRRVPDARLGEDVELVEQGLAEPVRKGRVRQAGFLPGVDRLLPLPRPDQGLGGDAEGVRPGRAEEGRVFLLVLGPGLEFIVRQVPGDGEGHCEGARRA